jgi:DNA-binding transcriptional ArsR family regulator
MEGVKERHLKYFRAVSNPLRRDKLKALEGGEATINSLQFRTNLDSKTLEWHLFRSSLALTIFSPQWTPFSSPWLLRQDLTCGEEDG